MEVMSMQGEEIDTTKPGLTMLSVQVTSRTKSAIYKLMRADTHPNLSDWVRDAIRDKIKLDAKEMGLDYAELLGDELVSSTAGSSGS